MSKALLFALLQPNEMLKKLQDKGDFTKLMYFNEKIKILSIADVWNEYLSRYSTCEDYYEEIENYELEILSKRE